VVDTLHAGQLQKSTCRVAMAVDRRRRPV